MQPAVGCRSGYAPKIKKRKHEETESSEEENNKIPVFGFPNAIKKPGLRKKKKWINFVKRKDWVPTVYSGICNN